VIEQFEKLDIVLILGNYAAGKSSFAREYFKNRIRINRHEIRHQLVEMTGHGEKWDPDRWDEDLEGIVKHMEFDIIAHFLERGKPIVIDNTSLFIKSRKRYIDTAKRYRKSIGCIFLKRDISTLLKQNAMRAYAVPEHIIVTLQAKIEFPSEEEGFDRVVIL